MRKLGCLERVDLRDIWSTEAQDFTPWLAREENLAIRRLARRLVEGRTVPGHTTRARLNVVERVMPRGRATKRRTKGAKVWYSMAGGDRRR